jgi:HEAT repeat protein
MKKHVPITLLPALVLALAADWNSLRAQVQNPVAPPALEDAAPPRLAPWSWPTTPSHLRIATTLRAARRAGTGDHALLQQRIVESGLDAVAAQVDILLRNRVPETGPKDGPQVLSDVQRDLLLGALAQMPPGAVRKELDAYLANAPDDSTAKLGAMQALGVVGNIDDLERLVALAPRKPGSPEQALPSASRNTLRSATCTLLRRLTGAWTALPAALRAADPEAGRVMLDALACARDPRALPILLEIARTSRALKWAAVSAVPTCGSSLNTETDRQFLEWMRSELDVAEPAYARTLLMAAGTLDDGEWVPVLIERLTDENGGLRAEALSSLRRITGLGFAGDPAAWRAWYETESRWHNQIRPQLLAQLSSGETPKVLSAVREYSEHRTRRAEMVDELVRLLEHGKPEVRGIVISVLEHIGSPAACTALAGMTRDSDAKVVDAAWRALRSISGLELARDPEQLRRWFERS